MPLNAVFGRQSVVETLTDDPRVRRALRTGVGLAALNLVLWSGIVMRAAPIEWFEAFVGNLDAPPKSEVEQCWDCPSFIMMGRELGSHWDPVPVKVLTLVNAPAIWVARGDAKRFGIREIHPVGFAAVASLQWLLLGAIGSGVRSAFKRTTAPSLSEVL